MKKLSAGIRSLAIALPRVVRTNEYFTNNFPELVANADDKAAAKALKRLSVDSEADQLWAEESAGYLSDPFCGTVERRVVAPEESSLTMGVEAARRALDALALDVSDVDLLLSSSMFPNQPGPGDAIFQADGLDYDGPAWGVESMCAAFLASEEIARCLVETGRYRNVLIVNTSTYSRFVEESDTFSFVVGDGAAAAVVAPVEDGGGALGSHAVNTRATCGTFYVERVVAPDGPREFIRASGKTAAQLPDLALKYLHECCHGALDRASITLEDIDFFVCFNATAWYASFCARGLGLDPSRTLDIYPWYGAISVVSLPVNLYHCVRQGLIRPGDLVLAYAHGFSGTSMATVLRWGDVILGAPPATLADLSRFSS